MRKSFFASLRAINGGDRGGIFGVAESKKSSPAMLTQLFKVAFSAAASPNMDP